jgi:hypothetical protein
MFSNGSHARTASPNSAKHLNTDINEDRLPCRVVDDEIYPGLGNTQFLQFRFRGFYLEEGSAPIHFPTAFDMKEV